MPVQDGIKKSAAFAGGHLQDLKQTVIRVLSHQKTGLKTKHEVKVGDYIIQFYHWDIVACITTL